MLASLARPSGACGRRCLGARGLWQEGAAAGAGGRAAAAQQHTDAAADGARAPPRDPDDDDAPAPSSAFDPGGPTWTRDFRAGMLQPRIVPFQVSAAQAAKIFEAWHDSRWLAPSHLLRGVDADAALDDGGGGGGTAAASSSDDPAPPHHTAPIIRPALLPFWLFETGVHVEYRGEIRVPQESEGGGGGGGDGESAAPPAPSTWKDMGWRSRGYREYPWTLGAMQVCATYAVRRDLASAAAVPGFLGRSRPLRRAEAEAGVALDVGWADVAGRGDEAAALAPRDMRQAVAWALAMQAVRRCELRGAARALAKEAAVMAGEAEAPPPPPPARPPFFRRRGRTAASTSPPGASRPAAEDVAARPVTPPSLWSSFASAISWAAGRALGGTRGEGGTAAAASPTSPDAAADIYPDYVRNVRVRLRPARRRARVVYLPAFRINYTYGERRLPTGERRPSEFEALVSGLDDGAPIAAERHVSPVKAQAAAAAAAAALGGGAALAAASAWPPDLVPVAFWAFLSAAAAGAAARASTHLLREADEAARLEAEEAAFERFSAASGLGPTGADPDADAELEASEWRRWEEADRWCWEAGRRGAWAEALATDTAKRRVAARRARADAAAVASRIAADAEADRRRAERHGGGGGASGRTHHHHHHHHHAHAHAPPFLGAAGGSRPVDHLGLYRALGLHPPRLAPSDGGGGAAAAASSTPPPPPPTPEEIRAAFRRAALRWHPDRQPPGDAVARRRASGRFAAVRVAYETLRDPRRRAEYDAAGGWTGE